MSDDDALDPVLLRSFLAVAETLGFTAAARRRGLGQSTVSQHIARLEVVVGRTLLLRTTKRVELTADGEALAEFARDIIAANDRALGFFAAGVLRGRLRLGVSEDLVLSRLPEILGAFRARHREVDVHLSVGLSARLYDMLDRNALDLLVAKRLAGDGRGTPLWRERLAWYGDATRDPGAPVPLVVFEGTSITRKLAIEALDEAGQVWQIAFSSDSLAGVIGAVRAGYGVTAQSPLLAQSGMPDRAADPELPPLGEVEFVIVGRTRQLQGAAAALFEDVLAQHPAR